MCGQAMPLQKGISVWDRTLGICVLILRMAQARGMEEHRHDISKYLEYIDMFDDFFEDGVMVSTYKAVFLRSLLDIGKHGKRNLPGGRWIHIEGDKVRLDLDFIAVRFIKYYWDMEVAFNMRHMPERMADDKRPTKDINIVSQIRGKIRRDCGGRVSEMIQAASNPPTLEDLASDEMSEFRKRVIGKSIKPEVLKNLLNDMPRLYTRARGKNHIILDRDVVGFMKTFAPVLRRALNYSLALHFEKNNASARHIATKIDGERRFESRLASVQKLESKISRECKMNERVNPAASS